MFYGIFSAYVMYSTTGLLRVVDSLCVGLLIMLSRGYNPQTIVPSASNYRANSFPTGAPVNITKCREIHTQPVFAGAALMYGLSVIVGQVAITYFMTDLFCCWCNFTVNSLYLKGTFGATRLSIMLNFMLVYI